MLIKKSGEIVHKLASAEKLVVVEISEEYLAKKIANSDSIMTLKNIKNEIADLLANIEDQSQITNEINSKLYETLKPNLFHEMYENILMKYFSDFYKSISATKEFTNMIESILSYYYRIKNDFDINSILNLGGCVQQTFISKLSITEPDIITAITSDNILQKHDLNNI